VLTRSALESSVDAVLELEESAVNGLRWKR